MCWKNLASANRFSPDKALKCCIIPKVHYQSASQQHTGKSNTWRGNIHYTQEELCSLGPLVQNSTIKLLLAQKIVIFPSFIFYGCHLFLWPGDKQYMFQTMHEIAVCVRQTLTWSLAKAVADQKMSCGSVRGCKANPVYKTVSVTGSVLKERIV